MLFTALRPGENARARNYCEALPSKVQLCCKMHSFFHWKRVFHSCLGCSVVCPDGLNSVNRVVQRTQLRCVQKSVCFFCLDFVSKSFNFIQSIVLNKLKESLYA